MELLGFVPASSVPITTTNTRIRLSTHSSYHCATSKPTMSLHTSASSASATSTKSTKSKLLVSPASFTPTHKFIKPVSKPYDTSISKSPLILNLPEDASEEEIDDILCKVYEQLLGATWEEVFESDHSLYQSELLLFDGMISLRCFVAMVCKSPIYKAMHLIPRTNEEAVVDLVHKVLGRNVQSQEEVTKYLLIVQNAGFDSLVDALVESKEYEKIYGNNSCPMHLLGMDNQSEPSTLASEFRTLMAKANDVDSVAAVEQQEYEGNGDNNEDQYNALKFTIDDAIIRKVDAVELDDLRTRINSVLKAGGVVKQILE